MGSLTTQGKCEFLFENAKSGAIGETVAKVAAFFFLGAYPILESGIYSQTSKLRVHTEKFDNFINYSGIEGVTEYLGQVLGEEAITRDNVYNLMKKFQVEFNPEGSPDPALTTFMSQFIYFRKERDGRGIRSRDPVSLKPLLYNDAVNGDYTLDAFIERETIEWAFMSEWIPRTLDDGSNYDREEEGMATTYHTRPVIVGLPRFMLIGYPGKFDPEKLEFSQRLVDQLGSNTSVSVDYRFVSVMVRGSCFLRLDDDTFFDFEKGGTVGKKHVALLLSDDTVAKTVYILAERHLDTPENEALMKDFCVEWIANQGGFRHWTSANEMDDFQQESILLRGDEDVEENIDFYQSSRKPEREASVSSMENDEVETDVDDEVLPANEESREIGGSEVEPVTQVAQNIGNNDDDLEGWDL